MTISQLRMRCRSWLDDPAHKPDFGHKDPGQDQYDLASMRSKIADVMFACGTLMRNGDVLRVLDESEAVAALLNG